MSLKFSSLCFSIFLTAAATLAILPCAWSTVTVKDADIVKSGSQSEYSYTIPYEGYKEAVESDADSIDNMSYASESGAKFMAAKPLETAASLSYTFDFSSSGYRPEVLELTNGLVAARGSGTFNSDVTVTSSYRLSESDPWIVLDTLENSNGQQTLNETHVINMGSHPDKVYYKVEFSTPNSDGFGGWFSQWGRQDLSTAENPSTPSFSAKFTVVPAVSAKK